MNVLIVGLGSIGLKHYDIIKKLKPEAKFYALRSRTESIQVNGIENIFKNYIKEYFRYIVILFFGLLHGLGFALVLSDIGYRSSTLFLNLISFNIGIEVAQISIILFLYLLVAIKFANKKYYRIAFQIPSCIFIASIGLYWFIERIGFL